MAVFSQPPTDVKVNSYVDLDRANYLLARRLHTEAWDNASESPGARNYVVDDPGASLAPGATTIPIRDGAGDWTTGNVIQFGDPATGNPTYTVSADFPAGSASITIDAPGLLAPVPLDGVAIYRYTPNEKEAALIWSACVLDGTWDWVGSQRYASRGSTATSAPQQNLRWPRSGADDLDGYTYESDEYPEPLESLTAEQALYLLQRDLAKIPDVMGLGFKKAEIPGPQKVEVDPQQVTGLTPSYLWTKYRELGTPTPGANPGSMQFMPLRRV